MTDAVAAAGREAEVRRALGRVDDPELDEPVTDLRFIDSVCVDRDGAVAVGFRLPTYWCAANFAFLMAHDMRREVSALPWVSGVTVTLGEHMYAEAINRGIAGGLSFRETFGAEAEGELDELRRTFLVKSFQRRQEALLRHLLADGLGAETIVALSAAALAGLDLSPEGERLRARYLERRRVCAGADETLAFVDREGNGLLASLLASYLRALASVGIAAEFNGVLCRGLLAARFDEPVSDPAQPTLRDFVSRAAAERAGRAEGAPTPGRAESAPTSGRAESAPTSGRAESAPTARRAESAPTASRAESAPATGRGEGAPAAGRPGGEA